MTAGSYGKLTVNFLGNSNWFCENTDHKALSIVYKTL